MGKLDRFFKRIFSPRKPREQDWVSTYNKQVVPVKENELIELNRTDR